MSEIDANEELYGVSTSEPFNGASDFYNFFDDLDHLYGMLSQDELAMLNK
jgi:hypothetical protein